MSANAGHRATTSGTRVLLGFAGVIVLAMGLILTAAPERTHDYFAWTIRSPLTAAFLGSAYLSSSLLELNGARRKVWAHSRIAVPSVLLFAALTLVVSLLHIDLFHLQAPAAFTRFVTWAWIGIYAVVPLLMAFILVRQLRTPGTDPARQRPAERWFRVLLGIHAAVLIPFGIALLLHPERWSALWPWPLTPLTGRAVGAWLVGLGLVAAHAAWENDAHRLAALLPAYTALGLLQLVAVARYAGEMRWETPQAWVFLAFLVSYVLGGALSWWRWRDRQHEVPAMA
jgi:hypothetical protein